MSTKSRALVDRLSMTLIHAVRFRNMKLQPRNLTVLTSILLLLTTQSVNSDVNGGKGCAACTLAVGIVEQLAQLHATDIADTLSKVCSMFPQGVFKSGCKDALVVVSPLVIGLLEAKETPDVVCHSLGVCFTEPSQSTCNIYPLPQEGISRRIWKHRKLVRRFRNRFGPKIDICDIPGIKEICEAAERFIAHYPLIDLDGDTFSTYQTLRGSDWRGKDCNDALLSHYPGRRPEDEDKYSDSNCNGIYGVNPDTGTSFEKELCSGSNHRGVAALGDSAAAHFHIPKEWLTPSLINKEVFQYLPYIITNELDWPMASYITGYMNITWPVIEGPTDSLYMRMVDRNRCIHRDYQSISVNGARSHNMQKTQKTLSRNQTADYPLTVVYALLANDVCNGHADTVASMTTAEEFRENVLDTLEFLKQTLPTGSKVILTSLVDARILFETQHSRFHPLGELRSDVTYADLYEYLNCLQISPCAGYLTSNATLRNITYERASNLSKVLEYIVGEYYYPNFDMVYFDLPLNKIFEEWEKEHGPDTAWQLIEAVDGFHPSQYGQAAFASKLGEFLEAKHPDFLGEINMNNAKILEIFGDQGGY